MAASDIDAIYQRVRGILVGRQESYDSPQANFDRIATMWSVILGIPVTASQVAMCMIAMKMTREVHQHKLDNIDDTLGYAFCLAMLDVQP